MQESLSDDPRLRALMARYQAGELSAFDALYGLVAPAVRRFLHARLRDAAKVEDLTQETFLQIHRARHTYDAAYPVMPWAMAIARHVLLMQLRTESRRLRVTDAVGDVEVPVRGEADAYADRDAVQQALHTLPHARRHAVIAHHVWGLSFREIASRAGIRETAAKLRSSRGIAQLRVLLGGRHDPSSRSKRSDND